LLSISFFRNYDVFNTLVVCAFLILCIQPQALFDVGFQLSFLSVFFILWLASDLLSFGKNNRVVRYVLSLVTVSCVAQLATLPLTLYYFGIFPLYFLPANLCLIPLVTLLIPLLLVWLLLSFIPGVSWWLSKVIHLLLQTIASLSDAISELPYAIINFTLTEYEVFGLYVLMFVGFAILKYKKLRSFLLSKLFILSLSLRKR
ncbi:MAG: ComEC/Rec2 family competence protein, partial [Tannerellaceae bacterium]